MTGPQPSRPDDNRPPGKPGLSTPPTVEEWVQRQLAKFPPTPPPEAIPVLRRIWLPKVLETLRQHRDSAA